jgi:hypothetical protein
MYYVRITYVCVHTYIIYMPATVSRVSSAWSRLLPNSVFPKKFIHKNKIPATVSRVSRVWSRPLPNSLFTSWEEGREGGRKGQGEGEGGRESEVTLVT